jgi:hypothetical protein
MGGSAVSENVFISLSTELAIILLNSVVIITGAKAITSSLA